MLSDPESWARVARAGACRWRRYIRRPKPRAGTGVLEGTTLRTIVEQPPINRSSHVELQHIEVRVVRLGDLPLRLHLVLEVDQRIAAHGVLRLGRLGGRRISCRRGRGRCWGAGLDRAATAATGLGGLDYSRPRLIWLIYPKVPTIKYCYPTVLTIQQIHPTHQLDRMIV